MEELTIEYKRDVGRMIAAELGQPHPWKALVLLELGIGSLLAMGAPLDEILEYAREYALAARERIKAGLPSHLDEPKAKGQG